MPYPDLTEQDMREFAAATRRVYGLMRDGRWHTASAIIEVADQREGLRRMRELRKFFRIERRRDSERHREFSYRLSWSPTPSVEPEPARTPPPRSTRATHPGATTRATTTTRQGGLFDDPEPATGPVSRNPWDHE